MSEVGLALTPDSVSHHVVTIDREAVKVQGRKSALLMNEENRKEMVTPKQLL